MSPRQLLIDTMPLNVTISEDKGKLLVRGEFARCGVATENKRVYPSKVWESNIERLGQKFESRNVFGELDHPGDGRTSLKRVSHIVTGLKIEDGIVVGTAEILPETDMGRNLKALIDAGCSVGVSSRGYGSVKTNEQGESVVQEDYKLGTFDFVAEPADQQAFPSVVSEGAKESPRMTKKTEGGVDTQALKEAFARDVLGTITKMKAELREQVRSELLSDPKVAGSQTVVEQIQKMLAPYNLTESTETVLREKDAEIARLNEAVASRDLKIESLDSDVAELSRVTREMGYKYFLETQLMHDPDADLIRKLIGDVGQFNDSEELGAKIEAIRQDLEARRTKEAEAAAAAAEQEVAHSKALESIKAQQQEMEEALIKSTELNRELAVRLYTAERLANHPQAARLRGLVESANVSSREEVDDLIERLGRETPRTNEDLATVRARVARLVDGGQGPTADDENERAPTQHTQMVEDYNHLGASLGDLKALAGIPPRGTREQN